MTDLCGPGGNRVAIGDKTPRFTEESRVFMQS